MGDESIGDVMELWELGEGSAYHVLGSQVGLCEIRRTFPAQGIDPGRLHLRVEQEPIGASTITKGLERGNLRAS